MKTELPRMVLVFQRHHLHLNPTAGEKPNRMVTITETRFVKCLVYLSDTKTVVRFGTIIKYLERQCNRICLNEQKWIQME